MTGVGRVLIHSLLSLLFFFVFGLFWGMKGWWVTRREDTLSVTHLLHVFEIGCLELSNVVVDDGLLMVDILLSEELEEETQVFKHGSDPVQVHCHQNHNQH